jgi:hypothetical protein
VPEVYQLRNHKSIQSLLLLSLETQDYVVHEFVAYVQQLARYVDMQDVDMQAQ